MRILITGAGGFIGSNMIAFLKKKGHWVRGVDKAFRKERKSLTSQADELIYFDLTDLAACIIACQDVDYVIHFAADMGGVGYFSANQYSPFVKNMQIDLNMLRACEYTKVKRMFYASSACAYPTHLQMEEGNAPKLREDQLIPANSDQMYGWEKFMMTILSTTAPIDVRVGIQHTIFGPYQEIEGERMKFPTAIATKVLEYKKKLEVATVPNDIEIWGNGRQIRSFLYIDDALERIWRVVSEANYPGPVNIGSDEACTVTQIAEMCCEIVGVPPKFIYTDNKPSGVLARNCDNTLFDSFYKYQNKVSTKEGFARLIKWIETNER